MIKDFGQRMIIPLAPLIKYIISGKNYNMNKMAAIKSRNLYDLHS